MKKCRTCGEVLPNSKFSKDPRNKDGLKTRCKKCDSEYWKEYVGVFENHVDVNKNCGGFKIYILNHVKRGEHKYNIISTKGEVWNYDSKQIFLDKLKELLIVA